MYGACPGDTVQAMVARLEICGYPCNVVANGIWIASRYAVVQHSVASTMFRAATARYIGIATVPTVLAVGYNSIGLPIP